MASHDGYKQRVLEANKMGAIDAACIYSAVYPHLWHEDPNDNEYPDETLIAICAELDYGDGVDQVCFHHLLDEEDKKIKRYVIEFNADWKTGVGLYRLLFGLGADPKMVPFKQETNNAA